MDTLTHTHTHNVLQLVTKMIYKFNHISTTIYHYFQKSVLLFTVSLLEPVILVIAGPLSKQRELNRLNLLKVHTTSKKSSRGLPLMH